MKRTQFTAALIAALMPVTSVMAHSEVTGSSGILGGLLAAAHSLVHALQTAPWLPAMALGVLIALVIILRVNKRES